MISLQQAQQVLQRSEQIYNAQQIQQAMDDMALKINRLFEHVSQPVLVLPVMNGGLLLSGHLMTRFNFPLQIDYLHATRYRNSTTGRELEWKAKPQHELKDRILLIIDDIFDEGYTLDEIVSFCQQQGASRVYTAVLVEKNHPRDKATLECDFVGLQVEDRYVFGFGMDYKSYHRNLDGIYAVNED